MPQPSPEDRALTGTFSLLSWELARAGISFRFQATGQSMYPTIRNGEMIHVAPVGTHKLRRGDIVLLQQDDKFRAHRIIQIKGESLITRGDASPQADCAANRGQIVGLVIAKECHRTGRLVPLAGTIARAAFRLIRVRSLFGRLLRSAGLRHPPRQPRTLGLEP